MINWIKKIFKSQKEDTLTSDYIFGDKKEKQLPNNCDNCIFKKYCNDKSNINEHCLYVFDIGEFDTNKETILIVDDHEGMVSFLVDDFYEMESEGKIKVSDYNILKISGQNAAFKFEAIQNKHGCLNVKYAILDITLGGSMMTESGIIKYTGVDIFKMIKEKGQEFKYIFYTGNNLNPYIKSNKLIIEQFKKITNSNLKDVVLFKTSLDMDNRRNFIYKTFFT